MDVKTLKAALEQHHEATSITETGLAALHEAKIAPVEGVLADKQLLADRAKTSLEKAVKAREELLTEADARIERRRAELQRLELEILELHTAMDQVRSEQEKTKPSGPPKRAEGDKKSKEG